MVSPPDSQPGDVAEVDEREPLWKPRRTKLKQVQVWRPRRGQRGELVQ
jgi:hypothetical protein